jgi:roadblock/LC7 domain-containing protein
MSEFDELVASPGVLMAGRFGPDGRLAEHKTSGLYFEIPAHVEMGQWFCTAITALFRSMAYALEILDQSGFNQTSWLPLRSWSYSGGDYLIVVYGDRFVIGERAKLRSLDELDRLLRAGQS